MMSDLNSLGLSSYEFIAFKGGVSLSPEVRMAAKKYPIISKLIQPTINNQWVWGHTQMMHFDLDKNFKALIITCRLNRVYVHLKISETLITITF